MTNQSDLPGEGHRELDWWERIGALSWQHVVLLVAAIAGFVALCFAPAASCSVRITGDEPAVTKTEASR